MKKILFVATVQSHIMNFHIPFIKYFQDKGYEVHVATKLDVQKYHKVDSIIKGVVWKNVDFSRSPFSANTFIALKQLITYMKKNNFNLVHVHTPMGAFLGRLAAQITKTKPVLYTAHGFHFYKGARLTNWILYYGAEKIAAKWTDGIITMNEEDYDLANNKLKTRGNNCIFKVNGVGVDLEKYAVPDKVNLQFKEKLGLRESDFVITVIAELIKRKNHRQVILAVEQIIDEYDDIKVVFVGDGVLFKEFRDYFNTKKLSDNILMLGFRKDVPKILNITDVVGLFSEHEGLPKILMEAMVAKKPIIATNIRGNNDLVENEVNGLLVELNDVEETKNCIKRLYNNRALAIEMGRIGYEKIQDYSVENVVKQMDKIYTSIMK